MGCCKASHVPAYSYGIKPGVIILLNTFQSPQTSQPEPKSQILSQAQKVKCSNNERIAAKNKFSF